MLRSLICTGGLRAAILGAALSAVTLPVAGASLGVSPTRVALPVDGQTELIRVTNRGTEPTLIQVQAFPWDGANISDGIDPAPEIIVAPPVFEIGPETAQLIRVALRQPFAGNRERAYRLYITQVRRELKVTNGVQFAVRLDIPVFVTPEGAAPNPVWTIRGGPGPATGLVLRNEGQAHLTVSKLALHEPGGAVPILTIDEVATALAGNEYWWPLDRPAHALPHRLEVRVETQRGELVMPVIHVRE